MADSLSFADVVGTHTQAAVVEIMDQLRGAVPSEAMLRPLIAKHVQAALRAHVARLEPALDRYMAAASWTNGVDLLVKLADGKLDGTELPGPAYEQARARLHAALWGIDDNAAAEVVAANTNEDVEPCPTGETE